MGCKFDFCGVLLRAELVFPEDIITVPGFGEIMIVSWMGDGGVGFDSRFEDVGAEVGV